MGDGGTFIDQGLLWRLDAGSTARDSIFHAHEHIELSELYRRAAYNSSAFEIEQTEQQVIVGTLLGWLTKPASYVGGHVIKARIS